MPTTRYHVLAYNISHNSENKIHDDTVAKKFGFTGGLVPGVDIYAYMMHVAVGRWGQAFLEHGTAECRFMKPVYDGDIAEVSGDDTPDETIINVHSKGQHCATGRAALPAAIAAPALDSFAAATTPAMEARPPATAENIPIGGAFSPNPLEVTQQWSDDYLRDVRERDPLYKAEGIIHPGIILRMCNWSLSHSVQLGPWIHVGSKVRNHSIARVGETLGARARVTNNYDHKGHLFVDLDVLVLANNTRPVAHVAHTAIYRPRQVAQAA
jgi:acyl dehydratase